MQMYTNKMHNANLLDKKESFLDRITSQEEQ